MPTINNGSPSNEKRKKREVRFQAKAVSRGVAIGKVVCLHGNNRQYFRVSLSAKETPGEVRRLRSAVKLAVRQLRQLKHGNSFVGTGIGPGIFDAHIMILEDGSFVSKIESAIENEHVNAEWAVKLVSDEYVSRYRAIEDDHLREKFIDVEDVSERLLTALGGGRRTKTWLEPGSIIVAKQLRPSTIVELHDRKPVGLITEHGGWTSHTFILARELNIPAVTGLSKAMRKLDAGDTVLVDGFAGRVIVEPDDKTQQEVLNSKPSALRGRTDEAEKISPLRTLDGREITIRANAEQAGAYRLAQRFGARGIGLFRSEFLFSRLGGFPTEHEQVEAYRRLAAAVGGDPLRIRTFDIGIGQLFDRGDDRERNPALGLRAIRLGLSHPKELRTQLRAILRASHGNNIGLVIPMVSGLAEVSAVGRLLASEKAKLEGRDLDLGEPKIGAMIEVPSAVMLMDRIVREVDFVCVGTNDLVQYLLAADRDNESVADWYQSLHPSVVRAIKSVIDAGSAVGKPVALCGEMAGSPFYVPLLLGLGARELSMNVSSIARVGKAVSSIAYEEAAELASEVLKLGTVEEIEDAVRSTAAAKWPGLLRENLHHQTPE